MIRISCWATRRVSTCAGGRHSSSSSPSFRRLQLKAGREGRQGVLGSSAGVTSWVLHPTLNGYQTLRGMHSRLLQMAATLRCLLADLVCLAMLID